jgi:hypothetical protein
MKLVQRSILGLACMPVLLACTKSGDSNQVRELDDKSGAPAPSDHVGVTTVTGADLGRLSNELAIERIVGARCVRETACNNVGPDKHFADRDLCARELRSRIGADLRSSECPRGVDSSALEVCIEAIRSESCNNAVETVQRLAACRAGEVCLKFSEKTR